MGVMKFTIEVAPSTYSHHFCILSILYLCLEVENLFVNENYVPLGWGIMKVSFANRFYTSNLVKILEKKSDSDGLKSLIKTYQEQMKIN